MQSNSTCQSDIRELLEAGIGSVYTAYQAVVLVNGDEFINLHGGAVSNDPGAVKIEAGSKFDIASITKLFTTVALLKLVEQKRLDLSVPVCNYTPEFSGVAKISPYPDPLNPGQFVTTWPEGGEVDLSTVTAAELLTHTSGIGAWYPIFKELSGIRNDLAKSAFDIARTKPFCAPRGRKIIYSDLGLIVLGEVISRITGALIDSVIYEVIQDLNIAAEFNPKSKGQIPATEYREDLKRRIQGEVHDENALGMGGIAPHAGLFINAIDLARFGEAIRTAKILTHSTTTEATSRVVSDGPVSRGLGFALVTPGPNSANGSFSPSTYGHYGFTGTSIWIDPERKLVAVLLTNRVYFGRASNAKITDTRRQFHTYLTDRT